MPAKGHTKCTQDIANNVLAEISKGISLSKACKHLDLNYSTVWNWINDEDNKYFDNSLRVYEAGCDALADECIDIADEKSSDSVELEDGRVVVNNEVIQRSRLRIDTRMRLIGKWNKSKYGDRQVIQSTNTNINLDKDAGTMTQAELMAVIKKG